MVHWKNEHQNVGLAAGAQVVALVFLSVCAAAAADTVEYPFSGRWRMDTTSLKGNIKPTIIELAAGNFKKDDGTTVKADGKFHQVPGDGYVDQTSISVENNHLVKEVDKIHGKLAYTVEYMISANGNTLT